MIMNEMYYTVKDAAKLLKFDPQTIRKFIKTGDLRAIKLSDGKKAHYRIHFSEVENWLARKFRNEL